MHDDFAFMFHSIWDWKKHSIFKREGNDIITDLNITLKDILTNKKIEIETIDNRKIEFICNFDDIHNWNIKKIIPSSNF